MYIYIHIYIYIHTYIYIYIYIYKIYAMKAMRPFFAHQLLRIGFFYCVINATA